MPGSTAAPRRIRPSPPAFVGPTGANIGITTNATKARVYGFEGDVALRPTPELTLTGSVGLTDAKYTHFVDVTDTIDAGIHSIVVDGPGHQGSSPRSSKKHPLGPPGASVASSITIVAAMKP